MQHHIAADTAGAPVPGQYAALFVSWAQFSTMLRKGNADFGDLYEFVNHCNELFQDSGDFPL
jgi:hypothetical protein